MRTQLAYRLAETTGPFGYLNRSTLPNMDQRAYGHFMSRCFAAYDRSKTLFVEHFKKKYGDSHGLPPYWMLVNIMDFGMMLTLFKGSPDDVKKGIANEVGVPAEVYESWLLMLNTVPQYLRASRPPMEQAPWQQGEDSPWAQVSRLASAP